MNEDIKEILEKPNVYSFNDECYLYFGDYNKLKNYITKLQEENQKLQEENQKLQIYKKFIEGIIITPDNWNNKECNYELHNMSKQYLYKRLFELRNRIINNESRCKNGRKQSIL